MASTSSFWALLLISVLALTLYVLIRLSWTLSNPALPPGPPSDHWFFGNTIPALNPYFKFEEWAKMYGSVYSLRRGPNTIIVVARYDAAVDIMEKQGASLADRPLSISAGETLSGSMRTLLVPWGPRLRKLRKALHAELQGRVAVGYEPIQFKHAKNVVLDILRDPEQHQTHAKRYAASVIMAITYGKTTPTSYSDPVVQQVNVCLTRLGKAVRQGAYLVDTFPLLRYVPFYLSELRRFHQEELYLFRSQMNAVRSKMSESKSVQPCFAKHITEKQVELELSNDEAAYLAGSMFGAGSDTTASAISIMMMAAAVFPEAQVRVQQELDLVVGQERCPQFYDDIPQVTAFYLECYRWRPVSVSGFAHKATKDIIWHNYCIPAGSTVIGSHWSIFRSPDVFEDPELFNPQRWIGPDGTIRDDLRNFNFGFGRRVCPGIEVANRSLFINTALILWAFKISEDPSYPIDTHAFTQTANMHPLPFKAIFTPRISVDSLKSMMSAGH